MSASSTRPFHTGVLIRIAYDGTQFCGWAAQRDERTVEETIKAAILEVDPSASAPRGTSRTDSGVHAEGQLAAFDTSLVLPARGWVRTLNRHLPEDVSVRQATLVPSGFSPRFANKRKRYRYDLLLDKVRDPLLCNKSWRIGYDMDMDALERESRAIVGTHDFAAFRSAGDPRTDTTRTIHEVSVSRATDLRIWSISVEGSAFLYNMVRILVGTLVDVARGNRPEGTIQRALEEKDRAFAGQTAPPQGLTLARIAIELPEGTGEPWPP